jgi:hypothetical protein
VQGDVFQLFRRIENMIDHLPGKSLHGNDMHAFKHHPGELHPEGIYFLLMELGVTRDLVPKEDTSLP